MNQFFKYCPNVFIAKCENEYAKNDIISITTKHGKEIECQVVNHISSRGGFFFYSIIRLDGKNSQGFAKARAEKLLSFASNANVKSQQAYEKSNKDRDFLILGEPIKVGHHSEKRHRRIIQQANDNMAKCVEFSDKAESYEQRAEYWNRRAEQIDLSSPESLEYFKFKLEEAEAKHKELKDFPEKRQHAFSLQYANKEVKELKKKLETANVLWG